MKARSAILALVLLLAASAFAQEEPKADYSRDKLLRLFAEAGDDNDRGIRFNYGSVQFRALGTTWNFTPIMLPFAGTRFGTTREWPDAFSLLNVPIATSPRAWRTQRAVNSELRRIDRVTKPKATVKVNVRAD